MLMKEASLKGTSIPKAITRKRHFVHQCDLKKRRFEAPASK